MVRKSNGSLSFKVLDVQRVGRKDARANEKNSGKARRANLSELLTAISGEPALVHRAKANQCNRCSDFEFYLAPQELIDWCEDHGRHSRVQYLRHELQELEINRGD